MAKGEIIIETISKDKIALQDLRLILTIFASLRKCVVFQ